MSLRTSQLQNIHDQVIKIACDNLRRDGTYRVYSNPGTQRITSIGNLYPDIILTPLNNNNVQFIIEVETSDSVTANEALVQWRSYSTLGGTFYLLVPQHSRILAENICRQYNIKAKFATWVINSANQLIINYE